MANSKTETTAANQDEAASIDYDLRLDKARAIVSRNVKWAAGAGLLPYPLFDFVAISTVQIKMLRELSSEYDIPFMEHKVKNILASLITGAGTVKLGTLAFLSVSKFIPVLGTTLAYAAGPAAAGALTHATGQVFIQHFESGGNFLDFNAEAARKHFQSEYQQAEKDLKSKAKKA